MALCMDDPFWSSSPIDKKVPTLPKPTPVAKPSSLNNIPVVTKTLFTPPPQMPSPLLGYNQKKEYNHQSASKRTSPSSPVKSPTGRRRTKKNVIIHASTTTTTSVSVATTSSNIPSDEDDHDPTPLHDEATNNNCILSEMTPEDEKHQKPSKLLPQWWWLAVFVVFISLSLGFAYQPNALQLLTCLVHLF